MARRRRVRGDRRFRKILNQMPAAIKEEMLAMLDKTGDQILAAQQQAVPVRTGTLRSALSKRLQKGIVRLRVGLVGKPINRRLWYARIVEGGRKAQTVTARRGGGAGGGRRAKNFTWKVAGTYQLRVSPLPPRPFIITARTKSLRDTMAGELKTYWDRVLKRAARGASDD